MKVEKVFNKIKHTKQSAQQKRKKGKLLKSF